MSMQQQDPIQKLRDAGIPVDAVPEEQRAVLKDLSEQELNTLMPFTRRLSRDVHAEAGPDPGS